MVQRKWLMISLVCTVAAGAFAQTGGPFDGNTPNMAYCSVAGDTCLSFDGVNDFVNLGDSPSLRLSGDMAVMAWVKLQPGSEKGDLTPASIGHRLHGRRLDRLLHPGVGGNDVLVGDLGQTVAAQLTQFAACHLVVRLGV